MLPPSNSRGGLFFDKSGYEVYCVKKVLMEILNEKDQRRLEVINLFGIIPNIPEALGDDKKHIVFSFWGAMYWGKPKKAFQVTWPEDAYDLIPNEINCFSYRKNLSEIGVGANPYEAYEDAVLRMNRRRIKRGAEIVYITSGMVVRNGANFYYLLHSEVMKIKK